MTLFKHCAYEGQIVHTQFHYPMISESLDTDPHPNRKLELHVTKSLMRENINNVCL